MSRANIGPCWACNDIWKFVAAGESYAKCFSWRLKVQGVCLGIVNVPVGRLCFNGVVALLGFESLFVVGVVLSKGPTLLLLKHEDP